MSGAVEPRRYCALPPQPERPLPAGLDPGRARAILAGSSKWVNGTVLHYCFLEGAEEQRSVVREAFAAWMAIPIGLRFVEVAAPADAEIRIGFDPAGGSWSFIGRGVLDHGTGERTMNFGWDLTTDYGHGTALHEIGHTIGLPHEHQNPNAGIAWDEAAVYAYFAGDPNHWARDKTASNVLHKLAPREVSGSAWDPDSIMEYWFPAGLITAPERYRGGLFPPGTLSALDREWAHRWYPADPVPEQHALAPLVSLPLQLAAPGQVDAVIEPPASRRYEIATFGTADTVLVLFEDDRGTLRYLAGDDDSGADRNAKLSVRLLKGRRYVARLRLYWAGETGSTALMYW